MFPGSIGRWPRSYAQCLFSFQVPFRRCYMTCEDGGLMSQHIYLRGYIAGIVVPTVFLLVVARVFTIASCVYNFPVRFEPLLRFLHATKVIAHCSSHPELNYISEPFKGGSMWNKQQAVADAPAAPPVQTATSPVVPFNAPSGTRLGNASVRETARLGASLAIKG